MDNTVYNRISMFSMSLKDFYDINLVKEIMKLILSSDKEFIPTHYGLYKGKDKFIRTNLCEAVDLWMNEKLNTERKDNSKSRMLIMENKGNSKVDYFINLEKNLDVSNK